LSRRATLVAARPPFAAAGALGEAGLALLSLLLALLLLPAPAARALESARPALPALGVAGGTVLEALVLPPYLDLVVFDIVSAARNVRDVEVAVFAPGRPDRPLPAAAPEVEQLQLGKRIRSVAVHRPAPGVWHFRKSNPHSRVKILSQQFFLRGTLVAPRSHEPLRQHEQVPIIYRVIDADGAPLEEIPDYPLSVALSLARPDGTSAELPMERRPEIGKAAFAAREDAICDLPGRYWTAVTVATKDLSARPVLLFQDHWSGFTVNRAARIDCRVVAPRPGEKLAARPLFPWQGSVPTRLQCLDGALRPVEMATLVSGPPASLFAASLAAGGALAPAVLPLRYRGKGVFEGSLHGAERPGAYRLRLAADQGRLAESYAVRVVPRETTFYRLPDRFDWLQLLPIALLALAVPAVRCLRRNRSASRPPARALRAQRLPLPLIPIPQECRPWRSRRSSSIPAPCSLPASPGPPRC
jgi:hypothetical protein